ncbi:MAG: hypothetical protein RL227_1723 [Pseudomonadota bacterium]|jgi:hypothetical protein
MKQGIALFVLAAGCAHSAYAGFVASATSNAAVRQLQDGVYVDVQPWAFSVADGNPLYSGGASNTAAASTNGPNVLVNGMTASARAEADLATGKLKSYAHVSNANLAPAAPFTVVASGLATFSDSFSVGDIDGGPFSWSAGSEVVFRMHLDGSLASTGVLGLPTFSVWFNLFEFGTVGSSAFQAGRERGGVGWNSNNLGGVRASGSSNMTWSTRGNLANGGLDLEARFNPMGNFDWSVTLVTTAFMNFGVGSRTADFGHTMSVGYGGPDGSTTTSSSGVFPGLAQPVSAPGSLALVMAGLSALVLGRRRQLGQR